MNRNELMRIVARASLSEADCTETSYSELLQFLGELARTGKLRDISDAYSILARESDFHAKYLLGAVPLLLLTDYAPLSGTATYSELSEWSVANPGWMELVSQALPDPTYFEEQVDSVVRSMSEWSEQRRAGS